MNYTALARFIGYLAAIALGGVLIILGAVRGDFALIAAGAGFAGLGGMAAPNTPVRTGNHGAS